MKKFLFFILLPVYLMSMEESMDNITHQNVYQSSLSLANLWKLSGNKKAPSLKFITAYLFLDESFNSIIAEHLPEEMREYIESVRKQACEYSMLEYLGMLPQYMLYKDPNMMYNGDMRGLFQAENHNMLMHAAINDPSGITVSFLCNRGANVNATNQIGKTALIYAVGARNFETVKILLERGANTIAKDIYSNTPLALAVFNDDVDILELLLIHHPDLDANQDPMRSFSDWLAISPGGKAFDLALVHPRKEWACDMLINAYKQQHPEFDVEEFRKNMEQIHITSTFYYCS